MGSSRFVSRFKHRARRYLPAATRPPGELYSRLDLRPARFVVGLGEPVRWAALSGADAAPVCPAFYLGRVEEVTEEEVLATVWERPSGREATTALSIEEQLGGRRPPPGSLLRLWTWVELPGGGEQVPRLEVEVEPPRVEEPERQRLRALVESLKQEVSERGEHEA
jgi:hypothetical protein